MHILTDRQPQDVFRGGQSKAKLPRVMTDNLNMQQTEEFVRHTNTEQRWYLNASAAFANRKKTGGFFAADFAESRVYMVIFRLVTCLSMSRSAYLMLGSSKVMAGLLFEKKSLKIRLMMLSKPPRISCDKGQKRENDSDHQLALATNCLIPLQGVV